MKNSNAFYGGSGLKGDYLEVEFQKWRRLQSSHPTDMPAVRRREAEEDDDEGGGWQCGNTRRRKRVIDNFIQKSSVHGIPHMCHGKRSSTYTRIFYRVLFGVCMVLVIANVVFLLREKLARESTFINSINKDTALGMDEDPEYFPHYPKITVCRQPSYKTDFNESYLELVEYLFMSLGYPFVVLTPNQLSLLIQTVRYEYFTRKGIPASEPEPMAIELQRHLAEFEGKLQDMKKRDENFNISKFIIDNSMQCEEFFLSCTIMVFTLQCCRVFKPVLTSLGLCYSLEEVTQVTELIHGVPLEMSLVLDLPSPPKIEKATEEGFQVFLTDPLDNTFELKDINGLKAPPGFVTSITTELTKFDRSALYTEWHGLTINCPQTTPQIRYKDDPKRYSSQMCSSFFVANKLLDSCNCESILVSGLPRKRYCEPKQHYECFVISCLKNNLSDIEEKCHQPCISYSYKSEASYVGMGMSNTSRIEIMYNAKQYISLEYRKTTMSGLLSQIGGALGLYLGASIITVVEILVFCFSWMWYRICPAPRRSTVLPTHHSSRKAAIQYN